MDHLRVLLGGVLDYAGLFPPARLPLGEALAAYETYRKGTAEAMLGRFVIPASRLAELPDVPFSEPSEFCAIGSEGEWSEARGADAEALNKHFERFEDGLPIKAYELKAPAALVAEAELADLAAFGAEETFIEIPLAEPAAVVESLALISEHDGLFAKARLTPPPAPEHLAAFIQGCAQLDLPFKLTAGLHHPYPHEGDYGFMLLLGACALCSQEDLSRRELATAILDAEGWSFGGGIRYRDFELPAEAAEQARELFLSFGSCSVDEPLEGLRARGLWPF